MSNLPTPQWAQLLGEMGTESFYEIKTAGDKSIYVIGEAHSSVEGKINNGGLDVLLASYSGDGAKNWAILIGGPDNDRPIGLYVSQDDSIYVARSMHPTIGGGTEDLGAGVLLEKYSRDGVKQWTQLYDGMEAGSLVTRMSVWEEESVYILGSINSYDDEFAEGNKIFLQKYSINGLSQWMRTQDVPGWYVAEDMSIADDGSIYIAGSIDFGVVSGAWDGFLAKYSSDGDEQWSSIIENDSYDWNYIFVSDIQAGADDSVYVAGFGFSSITENGFGGFGGFLAKYSGDGVMQWSHNIESSLDQSLATGVSVSSDGSVYAAGWGWEDYSNSNQSDRFLAKYSNEGNQEWIHLLGIGGMSPDKERYNVAEAIDGSICVAGSAYSSLLDQDSSPNWDIFLVKFVASEAASPQGVQKYFFTYSYGNGDSYSGDGYTALANGYQVGDQITGQANDTGHTGVYTITAIETFDDWTFWGSQDVYVYQYTDAATDLDGIGISAGSAAASVWATGAQGLGSESGYAYNSLASNSDYWISPSESADLLA